MTRVQMTQAVAADYADAMLVARRAKNTLVLLVALVLLIQLGVFFAVRFVPAVKIRPDMAPSTTDNLVVPTPGPSDSNSTSAAATTRPAERPAESSSARISWPPAIQYVLACTGFLGVLLSMVLAAVMWVIVMIMLVGRLVGVTHVMRAFCWSILFIVLLFPWQTLLNTPGHNAGAAASVQTALAGETPDPRIPGVLYTFTELRRDYDFSRGLSSYSILKWSRYVGFPALALLILLTIQGRSRRGLRYALGEAEIPMDGGHRV